MSFNHTLSAILRGTWLLEPVWAELHAPLAYRLLQGESVDFGTPAPETDEKVQPIQLAVRGYKVNRPYQIEYVPHGSVAIVDLTGPVTRYGGMCGGAGLEQMGGLVRSLAAAENISAIVLNVNSPGGEASGTASFASLIKNVSQQKPVVGIVDDGMAASAAMWIISACTEVYATNKQSSFGSIGAYTAFMDQRKALEAKGIKVHEIYAPQSTEKNKDYRDALEGNYTGVQADLKELVDHFIGDVQANRGGRINTSTKAGDPFTGKMFNATDAKKIGLIDGIMSIEDAIGRASELARKNASRENSPNNKMSDKNKYSRIAAAAGWEAGYEVPKDGLHLQHDAAANIETALEQGANDATAVAANAITVAAHEATIKEQGEQITRLTNELTAAKTDADAQRALATKYGAQTANTGTTTKTEKDAVTEAPKQVAMDPVTAEAMGIYARNRNKAKQA